MDALSAKDAAAIIERHSLKYNRNTAKLNALRRYIHLKSLDELETRLGRKVTGTELIDVNEILDKKCANKRINFFYFYRIPILKGQVAKSTGARVTMYSLTPFGRLWLQEYVKSKEYRELINDDISTL